MFQKNNPNDEVWARLRQKKREEEAGDRSGGGGSGASGLRKDPKAREKILSTKRGGKMR